ncbi:DUF3311 domain-containing protein [Qaidamihabitans albus]|uniref:DUF3311 domain-containing protein n=1 Tax=Qaidamihabitans albus TaxID=2795733 RepID=UPI0018F25635|nr:DUF3311 domain-containing protein [Qaidamihabitans albus]
MPKSSSDIPTGRWTQAEKVVGITWLTLAVVLSFPVYAVANRVEPIVLGLPLALWWIVLWTLAATVALFLVYRREYRKGAR